MKGIFKRLLGVLASGAMLASPLLNAGFGLVTAGAADVSGMSAMEITQDMGVGFNIGNSLDATGSSGLNTETSWGNVKTTEAMVKAIKAKGFKTIRVPVTWYKHMDSNNNVDSAWMKRVKEVVDYGYKNGMYVILNVHHDEWNRPTSSNYSAASTKLKALWKQIATEFKGYDRHLIFEGMNEPRNYNSSDEWNGGTDDMRNVVNKLNKDFVNTVRNTGGNNSTRVLMIPTYGASDTQAAMSAVADNMPDDDNIAVSVHAYEPYNFCMNTSGTSTWSSSLDSELQNIIDRIYKTFVAKDIPVVIGEMSASNKGNLSARVSWAKAYAKKTKTYGIPIVLWDNGAYQADASSSEQHGYLNRKECTWYSQSESVVTNLISTYKSTSMNLPATVSVPKLNIITTLDTSTYTVNAYTTNDNHKYTTFSMNNADNNGYIAVYYTKGNPRLVCDYNNWKPIDPTITDSGVAYFKISDLKKSSYMNNWLAVEGGTTGATITKVVYGTAVAKTSISSATVTLSGTSFKYTGSAIKPTVTVKLGSKTLTSGTDYTVSYSNNVNAGTATVKITGTGNYEGSTSKSFTIYKTPSLSDSQCTATLAYTSITETGSALSPAVTVKYDGKTLTKGTDYTVTYSNNTAPGTATVKLTGKGSYEGTKTLNFTINACTDMSKAVITLTKTSYDYTGKAIAADFKVTMMGRELKIVTDYVPSYKNNIDPGTATLTVTGRGSYSGTKTANFTIVSTGTNVSITLKNAVSAIDADSAKATFNSGSKSYTSTVSGSVLKITSLPAGTYTVKVEKSGYVPRTFTQTVTSSTGTLSFEIHKKGDVDGDGNVGAADVSIVSLHIKSLKLLSGYDLDVADVTGDGKLTAEDLTAISAHVKGIKLLAS